MKKYLLIVPALLIANFLLGQNSPIPKYKTQYAIYKNFETGNKKIVQDKIAAFLKDTIDPIKIKDAGSQNEIEYLAEPTYYQNIQLVNKLKKDQEVLISNLEKERNEYLHDSTKTKDAITGFFNESNKTIEKYKKAIDDLNEQNDSLETVILFQSRTQLGYSPLIRTFRAKNKWSLKLFNQSYYGKDKAGLGQNFSLNGTSNLAAFTGDLAFGFVGGVRVSLAGHVNETAKSDEKDKESSDAQKLFNNGGQFSLTAYSPLTYVERLQGHFHFVKGFMLRVASDLIANGTDNNNAPVLFQLGGDVTVDLLTDEGNLGLFIQVPYAYTFGNNQFYDQRDYRDFFIVQFSGGITLGNQARIKFSGPLWSTQTDLKQEKYSLGIQLTMPNGNK